MQKPLQKFFIIDFDSTFIRTEGLDELAAVALRQHPQKELILNELKLITNNAMAGTTPFDVSLSRRLSLLNAHRSHIEEVISILKESVTTSINRNKEFFIKNSEYIYIISGGFKDIIIPVVEKFGIPEDHVFANTFVFDEKDNVIDVDKSNHLSQIKGKVKQVKELNLDGDLYIIGDGYTDYELKKHGLAKEFIAFTENVRRETVVQYADFIASSFDEVICSERYSI